MDWCILNSSVLRIRTVHGFFFFFEQRYSGWREIHTQSSPHKWVTWKWQYIILIPGGKKITQDIILHLIDKGFYTQERGAKHPWMQGKTPADEGTVKIRLKVHELVKLRIALTDRLELALVYMLFVVPLGSCGSSSTRSSGLVTIVRYNQDISTTFSCALLGTGTLFCRFSKTYACWR